MREEGGGLQGQPHSYPASHRVRRKEKYTGIEKEESPEAKDRRDNLRKAGKKQVYLEVFLCPAQSCNHSDPSKHTEVYIIYKLYGVWQIS